MAYNNVIARGDVPVSEEYQTQIIDNAVDQSAAMTLFNTTRLSKSQTRFPVLSALPTAYWVNGDTGLKQTTEQAWTNKYLNVEELAAIVPVPENVLDDSDFDIWGEVRPKLETAIARALDAAIFFGSNAPASFEQSVLDAATAVGNTHMLPQTLDATQGGIYGQIDETLGVLEADGYESSGFIAPRTLRGRLRGARDANGQPLEAGRVGPKMEDFDGDPIVYAMRGMAEWGTRNAALIAGQWDQFVLGIRKDVTFKVLDQSVIQDNTGAIIYNLAQQDMVALRVTFRAGWASLTSANYDNGGDTANAYPAAVMTNYVAPAP